MAVISSLLGATLGIVDVILNLYIWVLIIGAVLSWLIAFDVVNTRSRFVQVVGDFCYRLTEPALRRIRRFVPIINGLDLSPLVLIFAIYFLQLFIRGLAVRL